MKEIIIFLLYFLTIFAISGMATFLMYQKLDGWDWLIFILVLLLNAKISVKQE
ncbi:hypothetical protein [Gallibacterium genomosp. 1]|uniref:hypothetical protein n=1 Tax=Gallibacterium genomosp. 1 TaxID=155515 RepID=UPI000A52C8B5|nr:hypothetical protein [Gallibacterium genomosp. 1]